MGYTHILWIYEDGIEEAKSAEPERAAAYESAVGKAILNLCLHPERYAANVRERRSHAVFGASNCVNWADEAHASESRLYCWTYNRLARVNDLADDELRQAWDMLDQELARRSKRRAQQQAS